MARIRIVENWLRSPVSSPVHYRSIMVVADGWSEQRVLMRAYRESADQTRPTIVLHGEELAIGPAGTDPNGAWGIHVQPPADGRAQELQKQLELAARRLAGTKGNPPRLEDEVSTFDRKQTNNWAPGTPRDPPGAPARPYYEPAIAAAPPIAERVVAPAAQYVPPPAAEYVPPPAAEYVVPSAVPAAPPVVAAASDAPSLRLTPVPTSLGRRRRPTSRPALAAGTPPVPAGMPPGKTALGWAPGSGAQSAIIRLGLRPSVSQRLARLVDRTVPPDFEITKAEREVLNALGESERLTARAVAQLIGIADPLAWMDQLMDKLARYGLDIVAPGEPAGGEPTYVLRR